MIEDKIKVFVKVDNNHEIVDVNSSVFIKEINNWIKIDEGYGDKYAHAQSQYFEKALVNDDGTHNYKFEDNKIISIQ